MAASLGLHAAAGVVRNRGTPVRHKFITFILQRKFSKTDKAEAALRLGLLALGAAMQVTELALVAAAFGKSASRESEAATVSESASWIVSYKVTTKWFVETNTSGDPDASRVILQRGADGAGDPKVIVSEQQPSDLSAWQPSGEMVAEFVGGYDSTGSTSELEEEVYDLSKLSDWTAWNAVEEPERRAIGALVGGTANFNEATTSLKYSGTELLTRTTSHTRTTTELQSEVVDLPLDQEWMKAHARAEIVATGQFGRVLLTGIEDVPQRAGLYDAVATATGVAVATDDARAVQFFPADPDATNPVDPTLKVYPDAGSASTDIGTLGPSDLTGAHPATHRILEGLDGSKPVSSVGKVDATDGMSEISATDRRAALKLIKLTDDAGTEFSILNATMLSYGSSTLADNPPDSATHITAGDRYTLDPAGRAETTYEITTAQDTASLTTPSEPSSWGQFFGGVGLNTEFMRWFAEFQEIDYQGNLANAEGFYEFGTNGPRPMFKTFDWHGITLKTGFVNQRWLWNWTQQIDWGNDFRRDLCIIMFDRGGAPLRLIRVVNAFPTSWKGPPLSAGDSGTQPIESIDLTCEALETLVFPV